MKVKLVSVQVMEANRESRDIAPLILNLRIRRRWVVRLHASAPLHPGERISVAHTGMLISP